MARCYGPPGVRPRLIDTVLEIDTPEHLAFQVRVAGPARRMFAWVIDLLVRMGIILALWLVIVLIFGTVDLLGVGIGVLGLAMFAIDWGYFFGCELITGGRSPGKIALKLRVVRANGLPVTWRESLLRNLVRAIDLDLMLLIGMKVPPVGCIVMALDPKFRRLGDWVAGTIVVVEETTAVAERTPVAPLEAIVEALPGTLPLGRDDLEAIELFVHRQHMSDARRDELAEIVADEYARRLAQPPPKNPTKFLASIWARAQSPDRRIAR